MINGATYNTITSNGTLTLRVIVSRYLGKAVVLAQAKTTPILTITSKTAVITQKR